MRRSFARTNLKIKTLLKDSNLLLGGHAWDNKLAKLVTNKVGDVYEKAILLRKCEVAKCQLSSNDSSFVLADLKGQQIKILRSEFEQECSDLVIQTETLLKKILKVAEQKHSVLTKNRLQEINIRQISHDKSKGKGLQLLLCGGAANMPMIKNSLKKVMGNKLLEYKNPELLISMGAAYRAYLKTPRVVIKSANYRSTKKGNKNKSIISNGLTTAHVIDMFKKIELPVTDDVQQIENKIKELGFHYKKMKSSDDKSQEYEAELWFKNLKYLKNYRPLLLNVIKKDFFQLADVGLDVSKIIGEDKLTKAIYSRLKQIAEETYKCDVFLAKRLVDDYLKERGIEIDKVIKNPPENYDPIVIQYFLKTRIKKFYEFCFFIENKIRPAYAYSNLSGTTPGEQSIELVQIAKQNEELGNFVYYIVNYWIKEGNPYLLHKEGINKQLDIYRRELMEQGENKKCQEILILQEKLRGKFPLKTVSDIKDPLKNICDMNNLQKIVLIGIIIILVVFFIDKYDVTIWLKESVGSFFNWITMYF